MTQYYYRSYNGQIIFLALVMLSWTDDAELFEVQKGSMFSSTFDPTILSHLLDPFLSSNFVVFVRNFQSVDFFPPAIPIISQKILSKQFLDEYAVIPERIPAWFAPETMPSNGNGSSVCFNLLHECHSRYLYTNCEIRDPWAGDGLFHCVSINLTRWVMNHRPMTATIFIEILLPDHYLAEDSQSFSYPYTFSRTENGEPSPKLPCFVVLLHELTEATHSHNQISRWLSAISTPNDLAISYLQITVGMTRFGVQGSVPIRVYYPHYSINLSFSDWQKVTFKSLTSEKQSHSVVWSITSGIPVKVSPLMKTLIQCNQPFMTSHESLTRAFDCK